MAGEESAGGGGGGERFEPRQTHLFSVIVRASAVVDSHLNVNINNNNNNNVVDDSQYQQQHRTWTVIQDQQ